MNKAYNRKIVNINNLNAVGFVRIAVPNKLIF